MEEHFIPSVRGLETKISDLSRNLDVAKYERDDLANMLHVLEMHKLSTKEHQQKSLDNVR